MSSSAVAVTELTSQEHRYLSKQHPELARHRSAVVVTTDHWESRQLASLLQALTGREKQIQRTIDALLPEAVPSKAAVLQARHNAESRTALLEEFGALTSSEVADLAGSKARNRAALANRWRQEGRILAVLHRGDTLFPAFQFDASGRPFPVIAEVLTAFGDNDSWEAALWFTAANGWLDGRRPVDLVERHPRDLAEAARREADELVF